MAEKAKHRQTASAAEARRHGRVALILAGVAAGMLGLSFAAVPLYRIFCQVTGYGGTTQRAEQASATVLNRTIKVRFDANIGRGLDWSFRPVKREIEIKVGENALAYYRAANPTSETLRGTATFNVTPEIAGSYFNKVECFCFTEQVLKPGQTVEMPVSFYIDPGIVEDADANGVTEITLSYTFFPALAKPNLAEAVDKRQSRNGS